MLRDLACPSCRAPLLGDEHDVRSCPPCAVTYRREEGIWRLLADGRREALGAFIDRYEAVRASEGRQVPDPLHLQALPFRDLSGKRREEWAIRARSFLSLLARVVRPLERRRGRPLAVLDVGSGVGWLAHRLAARGHDVAAVDLVTNELDGLGVHRHYVREVLPLQAEFDRLPLADGTVDLVVYNAAIHYATDYATTLREGLRVVRPGGLLVVMDSPIYRDASSGEAMVRERDSDLCRRSLEPAQAAARAEGFLTYARLESLGRTLGVAWELVSPWYGVRWWLRPWLARLRGRREPAQFGLILVRRRGES